MIDLRSDTVTQPTQEMKRFMMEAPLGDDVLGDDPSVKKLEETLASLLGKEASLFVPSGTMANQIAVRMHTQPGDELITEETSHVYYYESGAAAAISGVQTQLLKGNRGLLEANAIAKAIRPVDQHFPRSTLVVIENTHNHGGGTFYPLDRIQKIQEICQKNHIALHMDGARLWNACVAGRYEPRDAVRAVDTVSVCFSKGLGAPVGSCLAGERSWIQRARHFRKLLGGGMRQAGILAAGALYALENHRERLIEDHQNARYFAENLAKIPHVKIDLDEVQTNLIYFGIEGISPQEIASRLEKKGIFLFPERENEVRAVTHLGITRSNLDQVLDVIHSMT